MQYKILYRVFTNSKFYHLKYPSKTGASYIRDFYSDVNEAYQHANKRKSEYPSIEYKVVDDDEEAE